MRCSRIGLVPQKSPTGIRLWLAPLNHNTLKNRKISSPQRNRIMHSQRSRVALNNQQPCSPAFKLGYCPSPIRPHEARRINELCSVSPQVHQ